MSDIAPLHGPAATSYNPIGRASRSFSAPATPARRSDQIEFSDTAKLMAKLSDAPDIRGDLVARVRAEIAAGTYETSDKLDAAIDGLAEDLA